MIKRAAPSQVAEGKKDFRVFLWIIFKFHLQDIMLDPTNVQYDIAHFLSQHPATHKIIMAFRGIGKSYIAALYCIWRLWNEPKLSVLVISASKERSDQSSTFMLRLLKDIPFLTHLDPSINKENTARTSKLSFDVCGSGNKQSPSVRSAGILGMITGARADIILADDVEIPNNSDTSPKRQKLATALKEFVAIQKTGEHKEVIFLGTPQSQESIYNDLPREGDSEYGYTVRIWPAEYPENGTLLKFYGKRLSPTIRKALHHDPSLKGKPTDTRFNQGELDKRRALYGKSGYALQFLLNTALSDDLKHPLKVRDLIFMDLDDENHPEKPVWGTNDEAMIKFPSQGFEGDYYFGPINVIGDWLPYGGNVMTIDPSGRGNDETAYCCLKWGNGYLYVLACGGVSGGYEPETLKKLAEIADFWKVNTLVPERNMGGGMFGELMRPVLRRHAKHCAVPETSLLPHHSTQKETRIIQALEPVMNSHRLVVNKGIMVSDIVVDDDIGQKAAKEYQLFTQMTRLTRVRGCLPHDDRLDALAMAVTWAQKQLGNDPDMTMAERRRKLADARFWNRFRNQPNTFRAGGGAPRGGLVGSNWTGNGPR